MGWARFDDAYTDHPKVVTAGPLAELLDMRAILFSARYETDGHIPPAQLSRIGVGITAVKKRVASLIDVGRWHQPGHDCKDCPQITDGWMVHDYLEYNPSASEQADRREYARRRYSMNMDPELRAAVQKRDGGFCRYCGQEVNWRDRRSPQGGTYDHVIPISKGGDDAPVNIVTACRGCNQRKGPRTPEEAGMVLLEPRSTSRSDLDSGPKFDPAQHKTPRPSPGSFGTGKPGAHARGDPNGHTNPDGDAIAALRKVLSRHSTSQPRPEALDADPALAAAVDEIGWGNVGRLNLDRPPDRRRLQTAYDRARKATR